MLKTSHYNYIWPVDGSSKTVIFNSLSAATMEIKKIHLDLLDESKLHDTKNLDEERLKIVWELTKNGFLIEDFVEELAILKLRNASGRFSKDALSLTIIPTYSCNLSCFYCYQERMNKIMSPEVQENIVQYAAKNIRNAKRLNVCWFGGEPVMAWGVITGLSEKLIKTAEENGCQYGASMITNGYLLDDNKINMFDELKIKKVQITLDGPPEVHSRRKGLKGDSTENFQKILRIIERLVQKDIKLSIRVNIDKSNANFLGELMDILVKHPACKANIYPAQVTPYTDICRNVKSTCFNTQEFEEIEANFYELMVEKGLISDLSCAYPKPMMNFCGADQINSFTIDCDGYVYKCWNDIGNKDKAVYDICKRDAGETDAKRMRMRHIKWITWNPFEFEECLECKVLPLCMGGCPYKYKAINGNSPDCMTIKNNLERMVMNNYYCLKIKSLFE